MPSYKYRKYKVHAYFEDTWALSYKTIQCTCKPEDHAKGFLHIKYLVPSKTGGALDISDVNSSSENF